MRMNDFLKEVSRAVQRSFLGREEVFRQEMTLFVGPDKAVAAAGMLKEQFGFTRLIDLTAVDYWPQEAPRFHLVYQLYNLEKNALLRLRVPLDGHAPQMETIEGVYANANWKEREVYDMFGVTFTGHSDLRRILMPSDWQGHPLRKDYPLGYEEVQFTFNFDEIEARKPYSTGLREESWERQEREEDA
jgi:NADH-quinone oxidoreductase subunit C